MDDNEASPGHAHRDEDFDSEQAWDQRYAELQQLWSGEPNGALVAEVAELTPGRALDVGCGEGADAVWLATRGWDVTALDLSGVALTRAAQHAEQAGVALTMVQAGFVEAHLPLGTFDLVSAQYPALLRTPDHAAEHKLLAAVAAGGVLLIVHHVNTGANHGFDPADYVMPADVLRLLDEDWQVVVNEQRLRQLAVGAGAGHSHDDVLRARRLK